MSKRSKYALAALAVVVLVSNAMFRSEARVPLQVSIGQYGSDFFDSIPVDVIELRAEFDRENKIYEEMIKPYNARLDQLADEKLSADEAEALLREVDLKTGEQETKVKDLRADLVARMKELRKAHVAKRRNLPQRP